MKQLLIANWEIFLLMALAVALMGWTAYKLLFKKKLEFNIVLNYGGYKKGDILAFPCAKTGLSDLIVIEDGEEDALHPGDWWYRVRVK